VEFKKQIYIFGFQKIVRQADSCYKTSRSSSYRPFLGRCSMQALTRWWQRFAQRSVRHAWGLAPQGGAWILGGLTRPIHNLAKVHTLVALPPPMDADAADPSWLSSHLREHGRAGWRSRRRLNMAFPSFLVQEGSIDFPADLPAEDWVYEVQLDVAQALQLSPDEVNFDFEPDPLTDGLVQRVHWMGCAQSHMAAFKNCTRAAGWRLATVESEMQAAHRGARALRGGVACLLTQAPQDWQFRLDTLGALVYPPEYEHDQVAVDSEAAIEEALQQVMSTSGGPRLVAAGLALKAWL
jgi:hypothetical protein